MNGLGPDVSESGYADWNDKWKEADIAYRVSIGEFNAPLYPSTAFDYATFLDLVDIMHGENPIPPYSVTDFDPRKLKEPHEDDLYERRLFFSNIMCMYLNAVDLQALLFVRMSIMLCDALSLGRGGKGGLVSRG